VPTLEYVFVFRAPLGAQLPIGPGPYGMRVFFAVTGGEVEGPRLKGKLTGDGGDWALVGADGFARLDVRAQIQTDDGANIYMYYDYALLEMNAKVQQALGAGGTTEFGDHYYRIAPRFECGDPRYAWLTQSLFVAEGRLAAGPAVEYRVYRVS